MEQVYKLSDEALENVCGGKKRYVYNETVNYANVRYGPGFGFDVAYKVYNGDPVYTFENDYGTEASTVLKDGYNWRLLDTGGWIADSLID